jgi:hypothetical protein
MSSQTKSPVYARVTFTDGHVSATTGPRTAEHTRLDRVVWLLALVLLVAVVLFGLVIAL